MAFLRLKTRDDHEVLCNTSNIAFMEGTLTTTILTFQTSFTKATGSARQPQHQFFISGESPEGLAARISAAEQSGVIVDLRPRS